MSVIVRALEELGYVRRRPSTDDRRAVILRATPKGQRCLERARQRRLALLESLLEGCSDREIALLDRAARLIERLTPSKIRPRSATRSN